MIYIAYTLYSALWKAEPVWMENTLVAKLRNVFTQKPEFEMLAVGSNEGSLDCLFIKALFSHSRELMQGKKGICTVVEPNVAVIAEFKDSASLNRFSKC